VLTDVSEKRPLAAASSLPSSPREHDVLKPNAFGLPHTDEKR